MISLSIIVLSYNTKDLTIKCIESIVKQYKKELGNGKLEVVIVDNASSDASASEISNLKSQISNLRIILNKENLGFAKGCNIGARESKGKYILFLNSDTEVLDRGFLKMVEFLDKNPKVGILGGRLENNDGSMQPSAGKFYNLFNLFIMLLGLERFGFLRSSPNRIQKADWVSGGCMMVRYDIFEKLRGFDENFFMYIEDMELCYRAKNYGFLTYFYPNVEVMHKKLGSSNKEFAIINIYKGILYFYSNHKNNLEYLIAKLMLVLKARVAIFLGIILNNKTLSATYTKAIRF